MGRHQVRSEYADDYKKTMVAHDAAIAGYLSHHGINDHQISQSFTAEKTDLNVVRGTELL